MNLTTFPRNFTTLEQLNNVLPKLGDVATEVPNVLNGLRNTPVKLSNSLIKLNKVSIPSVSLHNKKRRRSNASPTYITHTNLFPILRCLFSSLI